jgi:AraC-like DNA-binding protein
MAVKSELEKLGLHPIAIELGEVELEKPLTETESVSLKSNLNLLGFVLIEDKKSQLIERIKNKIITIVHHQDIDLKTNLSDYLSVQLQQEYNVLSNLFSEMEGTTIEKYYIAQKIEKVKELLVYDELSLSEIAFQLHYSSVGHLSNQFKKTTGLTPSFFKQLKTKKRLQIDDL